MKLPARRGGRKFNRVLPALGMVTVATIGLVLGNAAQQAAAQPPPTSWPTYDNPTPMTTTAAPTGAPVPGSSPSPSRPAPTTNAAPTTTSVPGLPPLPPLLPVPLAPPSTQPGPGRIWTLTASKLVLSGSQFHGYAAQQVCGKSVQTLHFTVSGLHITDLVQRGQLMDGVMNTAAGAPGSVSTVLNGRTDLYTVSLTGTLNVAGFPLVPITLSPNGIFPPNIDLSFLTLPDLTFTNVVARNVDLNHGNLIIPGSHIFLTDNNATLCP